MRGRGHEEGWPRWGLQENSGGPRVVVALGSRLRGNDEGEVRVRREGAAWGRPGVGAARELGWFACRGCAGFPPSRERRRVADQIGGHMECQSYPVRLTTRTR